MMEQSVCERFKFRAKEQFISQIMFSCARDLDWFCNSESYTSLTLVLLEPKIVLSDHWYSRFFHNCIYLNALFEYVPEYASVQELMNEL